jgi:hypothetical protein
MGITERQGGTVAVLLSALRTQLNQRRRKGAETQGFRLLGTISHWASHWFHVSFNAPGPPRSVLGTGTTRCSTFGAGPMLTPGMNFAGELIWLRSARPFLAAATQRTMRLATGALSQRIDSVDIPISFFDLAAAGRGAYDADMISVWKAT